MAKTREEIVKEIVSAQINGEFGPEVIHTEGNLIKAYGLDSLDIVEVVLDVEEKFSVEFDDEETEKFERVGDILRCLERRLGAEG
jgi:acyl carrier protein